MQDLADKLTNDQLTAIEWNEVPQELQNIITATGQTLSSGDLTQVLKGITELVSRADFYTVTGTVNDLILTPIAGYQAPTAYKEGMQIRWRQSFGTGNTGAMTVNVAGLGATTLDMSNAEDARPNIVSGFDNQSINVAEYRSLPAPHFVLSTADATGAGAGPVQFATGAELANLTSSATEHKGVSVSALNNRYQRRALGQVNVLTAGPAGATDITELDVTLADNGVGSIYKVVYKFRTSGVSGAPASPCLIRIDFGDVSPSNIPYSVKTTSTTVAGASTPSIVETRSVSGAALGATNLVDVFSSESADDERYWNVEVLVYETGTTLRLQIEDGVAVSGLIHLASSVVAEAITGES